MISPPPLILVEDDPAVLQSLTFWLRAEGHSVLPFASAQALLDSQLPESGIFIIDQVLGETTGLDLLAGLRSAGVDFPAILVASRVDARLKAAACRQGVKVVEKPTLSDDLLISLNGLLAKAEAGRSTTQ